MVIPRELIYEEKAPLEVFGINDEGMLNHLLYENWLLDLPELRPDLEGFSNRLLEAFNDAYYICTIILMVKDCDRWLNYYLKQTTIPSVVMPMVHLYVSRLDEQNRQFTRLLKSIETATKIHEDWHHNLESLKETVKNNHCKIETTTFIHRNYTPSFLSGINWKEVTDYFKEDAIRRVLRSLARNEDEVNLIIDAINDALDKEKEEEDRIMCSIEEPDEEYYENWEPEDFYGDKRSLLKKLRKIAPENLWKNHTEQPLEEFEDDEVIEDINKTMATLTEEDIDEIINYNKDKEPETDDDDDNLSSTEKRIKHAIDLMKKEEIIKHSYDYTFIMQVMNETEGMPDFTSPNTFLDYLKSLNINDLPSEDSIKKKINVTRGQHPSWTFDDKKGTDANEARRRNNVANRFLSIYRKGK